MFADMNDLQVWLDTREQAEQLLVVPYARSGRPIAATYDLVMRKSGTTGASRIAQQGKVNLVPEQAQPLSRLTLDVRKGDECRIELSLREDGTLLAQYAFDCGR